MTNFPPGVMSAMWGTRSPMRLKSSISRSISASRAIASRCSTAFVEPPSAWTTAIAFSSDFRVTTTRAEMPSSSSDTIASPERRA